MSKLALFDVDGVLLSEERYFDASALTVWELLNSDQYISVAPKSFTTDLNEEETKSLRNKVFQEDKVLKFIKSRGINANWDMVYLTFSYQLIRILHQLKPYKESEIKELLTSQLTRDSIKLIGSWVKQHEVKLNYEDFVSDFEESDALKQELLGELNRVASRYLNISTQSFSRNSDLWDYCRETFQEWYVGDAQISRSIGRETNQEGKTGFMHVEVPLAPVEELKNLFERASNGGWIVGVGTGRPYLETVEPLKSIGLLPYINENHIATATDVLKAEEQYPELAPLAKPEPYTYIYAWQGRGANPDDLIHIEHPIQTDDTIVIIGDSLADGLAAQTMGVTFAAVLTGLSGKDARADFEHHNEPHIYNGVLDVQELLT
ncbi:phosphatase [Pontibacillus halophilus JSM 076056 = DSM 19796]|uniref:Phosphatase n=1 Tax=Pontibacillus halophilus JSM 076056 = DSM 19796 TaxID=1385510 RepID=A0A0A5I817_9BACI|nr:HAD hydrolase-like protein [Pontibacillus halophilus]KGX91977.1 phosphatase [Pontibacillus halophilus JSM 076056 = DSM 19796]